MSLGDAASGCTYVASIDSVISCNLPVQHEQNLVQAVDKKNMTWDGFMSQCNTLIDSPELLRRVAVFRPAQRNLRSPHRKLDRFRFQCGVETLL